MSILINIDVLEVNGIPPEIVRVNGPSTLRFTSEITLYKLPVVSNTLNLTDESDLRTSNTNLNWILDTTKFNNLIASQPKLKITLIIQTRHKEYTAFSIIDLRDLGVKKSTCWCKVNGFKDAKLLIRASTTELLSIKSSIPSDNKPDMQKNNTTTETYIFLLKLVQYDYFPELLGYYSEQSNQKFILKWSLFGETFQSEEFINDHGYIPKPVEDIFELKCSSNMILDRMNSQFPLAIHLCSTYDINTILATAYIQFPIQEIVQQNKPYILPSDENFHISSDFEWFPITLIKKYPTSNIHPTTSRIQVGLELSTLIYAQQREKLGDSVRHSIELPDNTLRQNQTLLLPIISGSSNRNEVEEQYEDMLYSNDDFETDDVPATDMAQSTTVATHTTTVTTTTDANVLKTGNIPNESTTTTTTTNNNSKTNKQLETILNKNVIDPHSDDSHRLHHYRLHIHIKTVMNFKRSSHLLLSYTYPHLGANTMIRTHPLWVAPYIESKIDGGTGIYDCCMTPYQFNDILSTHPLKIHLSTKSHLGTGPIGESIVDLSYIHSTTPISYKCPITSKLFKTNEEYLFYRQTLISSQSAGRLVNIPPIQPITIKALDSYYTVDYITEQTKAIIEGSKVRVVVVIEDIGNVGNETAANVRVGYQQQGANVYDSMSLMRTSQQQQLSGQDQDNNNDNNNPEYIGNTDPSAIYNNYDSEVDKNKPPILHRKDLSWKERKRYEELTLEWEIWQKKAEAQWRESMREKERLLKEKLEEEANKKLIQQANDLKRAHEEAGRLEIRLRETIDSVESQKNQLVLKEEQLTTKLAQKTAELQLFQKRIKDEAKIKIDNEIAKNTILENQIVLLKSNIDQLDRRYRECENDFELYRKRQKNTTSTMLREELAKIKAQLGECRAEVEREKRLQSEVKLEKEQIKSQLHRLALALKREKEKNNALARQDLEQLRLEFLAREERYILDGDREELRNIKYELASLRIASLTTPTTNTTTMNTNTMYSTPQYPMSSNTPDVHVAHPTSVNKTTTTTGSNPIHTLTTPMAADRGESSPYSRQSPTSFPYMSPSSTMTSSTPIHPEMNTVGASFSTLTTAGERINPSHQGMMKLSYTDDQIKVTSQKEKVTPVKLNIYQQYLDTVKTSTSSQQEIERIPNPDIPSDLDIKYDDTSYLSASDSEVADIIRTLPPLPPPPTYTTATATTKTINTRIGEGDEVYLSCIAELDVQLHDLLSTGLYQIHDAVIQAIQYEKTQYQRLLSSSSFTMTVPATTSTSTSQ